MKPIDYFRGALSSDRLSFELSQNRFGSFTRAFLLRTSMWLAGLGGVPALAASSLEKKVEQAQKQQLSNPELGSFKIPTPQEMYSSYYNEAVGLAKGDEQSQERAIDYFVRAIELDPGKAIKDAASLDGLTMKVYNRAWARKVWPQIEEKLKDKKSFFAKYWLLMALAAAAAGYGISKALHKKDSPTPPDNTEKDYKTNLNFSIYITDRGYVKDYTLTDIMTSSDVTIAISDLGLDNVDDKRMAVFGPKDNLMFIANTKTDGKVTFKVDRSHKDFNFNYTTLVPNHFTSDGKVIDYNIVDSNRREEWPSLRLGANATYSRGTDTMAGPDELITGANGGVQQIDSTLVVGDIKLGSIKKVDNSNQVLIYYYPVPNARGDKQYINNVWHLRIHAGGTTAGMLSTIIAELAELYCNFEDLNGTASYGTITDSLTTGYLNEIGKAFIRYCAIMYKGKLGATTTTMVDNQALSASVGNAEVAFEPSTGAVRAGYNGENIRGGVHHSKGSTDVTAAAQFDNFSTGFGMSSMQGSTTWTANGSADLEKAVVALSGMYNTTGANSVNVTVANKPKANELGLNAGYERQQNELSTRQAINAQASMHTPVGLVVIGGKYNSAEGMMRMQEAAINAAAQLNLKYLGIVYLNGSYGNLAFAGMQQKMASIGIGKPIGLGSLDFSWNNITGPRIVFNLPIPVK